MNSILPGSGLDPRFSFGWPSPIAPPSADPTTAILQHLLQNVFGVGDSFSMGGPSAASMFAGGPQGHACPGHAAGGFGHPGLASQSDIVRQQLNMLGLQGQRLAGPSAMPSFDPRQMQELMALLIGLILSFQPQAQGGAQGQNHGGGNAGPGGWNTGGFPGGRSNGAASHGGVPSSGQYAGSMPSSSSAAPSGGAGNHSNGPRDVTSGADIPGTTQGSGAMRYKDMAEHYGAQYGVPAQFILPLIQAESGGNPNAVGDNGASVGLFQIHKIHGKSVEWRQNPQNQFEFMMPRIKRAYDQGVAQGLTGRRLAEFVGGKAEGSAPQYHYRYGDAFQQLFGG